MGFEFKVAEMVEQLKPFQTTARDIGAKLGFYGKNELEELAKVLEKMVGDGRLEKIAGKYDRYSLQKQNKIKGTVRGNKRGFAFLLREDGGEDLFLPNKSLKGAMHGDTVLVRIVKGDEACVTDIVERGITRLVGTYQKGKTFGFVIADDHNYFSDIFIPSGKSLGCADQMKVVVEIVRYSERNPEGKIVEIIGRADDKQSGVLSILKSYGFFNVFPDEVNIEAERMQFTPTNNRSNFVDMPTITIDGEDSKDLDDAVSLVRVGKFYKLYVHIADVSHYVVKDSVLDKEAIKRATSVYFPGSVYPMLPPVLSNGICSLNEGEDRLTLTASMLIDEEGNVLEKDVVKSIINNDYRMTYGDVTKILDGDEALCAKYADSVGMIRDMYALSRILRKKRVERGCIEFETKESKIILDKEGNVEKIVPYPYTVSNEMIEDFMLLANESIAEIMFKKELPFVYRVHEKPDGEKISDFRSFLGGCGLTLPAGIPEPGDLQKLLKRLEGDSLEAIVSKVMLRSMRKARYATENLGHYGLAAENYCHFTSPIRRYPDLQIHRVIKAMLDEKLGSIPKLANWCQEVSVISSEREAAATSAERDIDDFYKTEYMQRHVGATFDGVVSGVTSFGIFVELENTCEGLARLDNLPPDEYAFIEERYLMRGSKHRYTLGQRVKIEVLSCDQEARRVAFRILEDQNV